MLEENSIRCQCGCSQLVVQVDKDLLNDGDPFICISFEDSYLGHHSNYGRLKRLARIIKNEGEAYSEVVLKKDEAIKFLEDSLRLIKGE